MEFDKEEASARRVEASLLLGSGESCSEGAARQGSVIAITDEGNGELDDLCEYVIRIPHTEECFSPLLSVVPLQLLSYHIAVMRGCSVDQPRNLAKSVTVE